MLESNKKIWEKLEENIGHCILFRDAALKEILGEESFTLQFATLTVPEKVEAFLEGILKLFVMKRVIIFLQWMGLESKFIALIRNLALRYLIEICLTVHSDAKISALI